MFSFSDKNNTDETNLHAILSYWHPNEHVLSEINDTIRNMDKIKLCLISGGEITWDMTKTTEIGTGGRNLHMTLLFQHELQKLFSGLPSLDSGVGEKRHVWFSSAGTDGIDGMTDVAGSIAYNYYERADCDEIKRYLNCFDSFNYYKNKIDQVIKPGHTGTNVMDIHILVIEEE